MIDPSQNLIWESCWDKKKTIDQLGGIVFKIVDVQQEIKRVVQKIKDIYGLQIEHLQ